MQSGLERANFRINAPLGNLTATNSNKRFNILSENISKIQVQVHSCTLSTITKTDIRLPLWVYISWFSQLNISLLLKFWHLSVIRKNFALTVLSVQCTNPGKTRVELKCFVSLLYHLSNGSKTRPNRNLTADVLLLQYTWGFYSTQVTTFTVHLQW